MLTAALIGLLAMPALASIQFRSAEIEFTGDATMTIHAAAIGEGVKVGSYGMRTVDKDTKPQPGFQRRGNYSFLCAAGDGTSDAYMLIDNGRGDEDPREGEFAISMDVSDWDAGTYRFMLFACNRPAGGEYVHDTRILQVTVADGKLVRPRTFLLSQLEVKLIHFRVEPDRIRSGQPVTVTARTQTKGTEGCLYTVTTPYTVGTDEVPPGLAYDADSKMAFLAPGGRRKLEDGGSSDLDAAPGAFAIRIATEGWKPGIYNLSLQTSAVEAPDEVREYRDFAITVLPENPTVEATLEHDQFVMPGTHFGDFCRLADGSVVMERHITRDGGITWEALPANSVPPAPLQLRDGTIIGCSFHTEPIEGREGYFAGRVSTVDKPGDPIRTVTCEVHVPLATGGIGHAAVKGPLFWRSAVEMPDGTLVAPMYGWFKGDEAPVPGQPGSFYYRTWLVLSKDRGEHWEYVSTIGYDPAIGTEGYCEPVLRLLPNDDLLCLLRTGGNNRPFHQDNPLCATRSTDGGKTWAEPRRTGFEGVAPDLVVMSDGTLACSTGRPGAWVLFSTDNGNTWSDAVSIDAERYSGYTGICEPEPGVLLVGYGAQKWLDPATGERKDSQRTVRVRVRRK